MDWSLFRGKGGLVQKRGGSMIFMQGKRVGHINLSTHIRDLCYTEGVGGSQQKMWFTKGRVRRIWT